MAFFPDMVRLLYILLDVYAIVSNREVGGAKAENLASSGCLWKGSNLPRFRYSWTLVTCVVQVMREGLYFRFS